jgi:hypothetical protein
MDRKVMDDLLSVLGKDMDVSSTMPYFADKRYKAVSFSSSNFKKLEAAGGPAICSVDGSNMQLMAAPHFSLQLIRTCAVVYRKNIREAMHRDEMYVLVSTERDGESIRYDVQTFPEKYSFKVDRQDQTMRVGQESVALSKVCELVRSLAEVEMAKQMLGKLKEGDVLVRDGSLEPKLTQEKEAFMQLFDNSRNVALVGLSKTTDLLTDSGQSVPAALNSMAPGGAWMYHPLAMSVGLTELAAVKLNEKSTHVFRLDFLKSQSERVREVCRVLAHHSTDPVFLGYPYGLIEAHKGALISAQERTQLLTIVKARAGEQWTKIEGQLRGADAHDVLDRT